MPTHTFHTRLNLDEKQDELLSQTASILSFVERRLFADFQKENPKGYLELKKLYIKDYEITGRQFNTIFRDLKGKIDSIKSNNKRYIRLLNDKIKQLKKTIKKLIKKSQKKGLLLQKKKSLLNVIHQKKRKLTGLEHKLEKRLSNEKEGKVSLCFGSKKLFNKQFNLEENDYLDHKQWLSDWKEKRDNQFALSGSKDETTGNQSCVITTQDNGLFKLKVRLPNQLSEEHVEICNVSFPRGESHIIAAIEENNARARQKKIKDSDDYKMMGTPLYYRFIKEAKGWRLCVSTDVKPVKIITDKRLGAIGVDINVDHLAVTETDRNGNPVGYWTLPLPFRGKTSEQREAIIGDAVRDLVDICYKTKKPLIKEDLDFDKKKSELKKHNPEYCRMLSSFAYSLLHEFMESRCLRIGVELSSVNPAYTSVIGRIKFAKRYGMSVHHGASLVIARRGLGFKELPPHQLTISCPTGKGDYVTFEQPVRNVSKHVWSHWSVMSLKLKEVLKAHFKRMRESPSLIELSYENLIVQLNDELRF